MLVDVVVVVVVVEIFPKYIVAQNMQHVNAGVCCLNIDFHHMLSVPGSKAKTPFKQVCYFEAMARFRNSSYESNLYGSHQNIDIRRHITIKH